MSEGDGKPPISPGRAVIPPITSPPGVDSSEAQPRVGGPAAGHPTEPPSAM